MYNGLVAVVIADIKALPDNCRQSGDDSNLKDVWEEFKDHLQNEQSNFFCQYAFAHTIQSIVLQATVLGNSIDRETVAFALE